VIVYTALAFMISWGRKWSKGLDGFLEKYGSRIRIPDRVKIVLMVLFSISCIFLYLYCWYCRYRGLDGPGDDREFLDWIYRDLLGVLPWFVWGCLLAGIVNKLLYIKKLRLPKSMLSAALFASLLPICSCAAVPMAHAMMLGKQIRVRTVMTFLIVVPVISPIVIVLALSQIGWEYLLVEIISIFILAFIMGIVIEKLTGVKDGSDPGKGCVSCKGCKTSHMTKNRSSALLSGWDQFIYLHKFIFLGIIIGGLIATRLETSTISDIFSSEGSLLSSLPGLVLIVSIGIPIFICSGEDVVILAPLLAAGLPLGHGIAFAISGNAICLTSIPVINATFGKKVTILIFSGFFVGSIIIGAVINLIAGLF
jgi:uncharacterized membrane protein YraQ (UPF0718 family)